MPPPEITLYLGMIIGFGTVIGYLRRVERKFDRRDIEHEILMRDYCERKGIDLYDLPTRTKGIRI